ncbi:MAG: FeoB small GTPase domain-containing protein [Fimbriimonadaceae bacterium]
MALVGNPNAGKTTLFNALTGSAQKVANYPGVTVEKVTGVARIGELTVDVIDIPGLYSLDPVSEDERVAAEVMRGQAEDVPRPDLLIGVLDATNLERNLYLYSQVSQLGIPTVVALSMSDVAARQGVTIDSHILEEALGVEVVTVVAHRSKGVAELRAAIERALRSVPS